MHTTNSPLTTPLKTTTYTTTTRQLQRTRNIIPTKIISKNGVEAQYDIRTDRFEIAQQAMEKVTGMLAAKREEKPETPKAEEVDKPANNDPTKKE